MNDNLITEIIDLNKVKANLLELQKMWEQLITTLAAKSGKDLKFDNLAQNLKTITTAETELSKAKQAGLEVDGKKVKITAEIIGNYEKYSKEEQKIIENEIKRKAQVSETNKLLKDKFTNEQDLVKVLQRETKSIADLDKQNKDLQRIQQKLNLTTKEGLDANAKINAQIEKNKETTKEYTNVLDKQRRNIGNYKSAFEAFEKGSTNLRGALKLVKDELSELEVKVAAGIKLTEEEQRAYERLRNELGQLTDIQGNISAQAKILSDDYRQINAALETVAVGASAFGVVQGAMVLLGTENEKVARSLQKLVAVQTMLTSIQKLQNSLNKDGRIMIELQTLAQSKNTAVKKIATGVTKALNTVLKSTNLLIGGGIALLGLAVVEISKYIKKSKELKGIRDDYTASLEVERQTMNNLFEQIKKTNVGTNERRILVDELNRNYKDYLPNLDLEKATLEQLVVAQKESNVELQNKIAIQAQDKAMSDVITKMTELKIKEMEATKKLARAEKNRDDAMKTGGETQLSYIQIYNQAKNELDAITFSLQAQEQQLISIRTYFRDQIVLTQQLTAEQQAALDAAAAAAAAAEAKKKAIEAANKRYADYLANIKKANEEAKLSIELGENRIDVRKKEIEAIYSATKAYFELNGYTADEIRKLKELRAEIDKLNTEIANSPKLLKKQDIEAVESIAKTTGEISMNMRNIAPAVNDAAAGLSKMDLITAKLRNAFNDFFGTEQIEDWRDTFRESITAVVNESFELYNQIIDLQNEKLNQELDNLDRLHDKQMSGLESAYDKRKKLLEATIDDEAELAAELARIEEEKAAAFTQAQDTKFAKEQEIAKKQAILAKKKAEMEVAAGSASALVEAIKLIGIATTTAAPGDPYSLAARIAAALAAALTVVTATTAGIAKVKAIEIPQFWTGGEAQEGQIISVAERGKELAVGESGTSYMFDKRSVFVAPEKMRIFSNKETKQIMEKQTINNNYEKQSNVNLTVNIDNERHKKYFKLT